MAAGVPGAGVAGVVAARSASGTTPFCAVGDAEGLEGVAVPLALGVPVAAPVAVPDGVPEGVAVPLGVPPGLTWVALLSRAWT